MVETVSAQLLPAGAANSAAGSALDPGTELAAKVEANLPGGIVRLSSGEARIDLRVESPLPVGADVTVNVSGSRQQPVILIATSGAAGQGPSQGQPQPPPAPGNTALTVPASGTAVTFARPSPALAHLVQIEGQPFQSVPASGTAGSPSAQAQSGSQAGAPAPATAALAGIAAPAAPSTANVGQPGTAPQVTANTSVLTPDAAAAQSASSPSTTAQSVSERVPPQPAAAGSAQGSAGSPAAARAGQPGSVSSGQALPGGSGGAQAAQPTAAALQGAAPQALASQTSALAQSAVQAAAGQTSAAASPPQSQPGGVPASAQVPAGALAPGNSVPGQVPPPGAAPTAPSSAAGQLPQGPPSSPPIPPEASIPAGQTSAGGVPANGPPAGGQALAGDDRFRAPPQGQAASPASGGPAQDTSAVPRGGAGGNPMSTPSSASAGQSRFFTQPPYASQAAVTSGAAASGTAQVPPSRTSELQQVASALRQPLAEQQAGMGSLFAQIGTLMSAQANGSVSLPDPVVKAMQQIFGFRLGPSQTVTARQLQQAVAQSGQFREAGLAQSAGTAQAMPDLKSALLSFKSLLQSLGAKPDVSHPANQPAVPARTGSPQGQLQQIAGGYWAGMAPQNLKSLLRETDTALARLRLTQLANSGLTSDDRPHSASRPMDLVLELPLAVGQETAVMQLQIGRDGGGGRQDEDDEGAWRLRFALDLTATGPLEAAVSLRGGGTYASLWIDRKETYDALNGVRETMEAAFANAGLDLQELRLIRGLPPKAAARSGALVNRQS